MKGVDYSQLTNGDSVYPSSLVALFGAFACPDLYYIGNLELLRKFSVGFCGSRSPSEKGLEVAYDCASQFAEHDVAVVSGYAKGVDTKAHLGALENSGSTIIVLPEGIEHFRIKRELAKVWNWKQVLVLSYFDPKAVWRADRAMDRNRAIVGLSNATIVIEARETGGTLHAGMTALGQHKPLVVAKYSDSNFSNFGNDKLIELGGIPLQRSKTTGRSEIRWILNSFSR